MATAVLTFNLDDQDDRQHYIRCNRSLDIACALFDILYNLRRTVDNKCDTAYNNGGDYDEAEMIYAEIEHIMEKYNIDIDELCT